MSENQLLWDKRRDDTSAAHTAKVAREKENARLRAQANREKTRETKAAATAALLQLPALVPPLPQAGLLQLPLAAPHPIPPPSLASTRFTRFPCIPAASSAAALPPSRKRKNPPQPLQALPLVFFPPISNNDKMTRTKKHESVGDGVCDKVFAQRTADMMDLTGGTPEDFAAHMSRLLIKKPALARMVLSNEALLDKIGSKGFLPKDVLNKLQSGQGSWSHFDCAVLKLTGKMSDLAWIVFARRFSFLMAGAQDPLS